MADASKGRVEGEAPVHHTVEEKSPLSARSHSGAASLFQRTVGDGTLLLIKCRAPAAGLSKALRYHSFRAIGQDSIFLPGRQD